MGIPPLVHYLDLFGVVIFAITGALLAQQHHINVLGFVVAAVITAVGGGTLRDVLLGETPVFWIQDPIYLILPAAIGLVIFFTAPYYRFRSSDFLLADALSLAVFTIIGTEKALALNISPINSILLGTITGVGGGVIRDCLLGRGLPALFQQELYATAAFVGGSLYWSLHTHKIAHPIAIATSILVIFCIRLAAVHWQLKLPLPKLSGVEFERRPLSRY